MRFTEKVGALMGAYPASITSWYRSPKRNKRVGGSSTSLHMLGLAVDVVLDSRTDLEGFTALAKRLRLWVLDEQDHVHIQEIP